MKLRNIFLSIAAMLAFAMTPAIAIVGTADAATCGKTPAAKEVLSGVDDPGGDCGENRVDNLFANVVNILSLIVGIASVIVIIYAGFKYVASGGESGRVSNAKSTLLYAVIGLAVAALAQLMVHFVLYQTRDVTLPDCATHRSLSPPDCRR